ncbi:MAG: inositol monophosphatase family protein [Acidimicrobiales bacterium]
MCVWFAGDIWDHAAPSIIVEEAGGRFTDHVGGRRLDTRAAIYSNGLRHDHVLAALAPRSRTRSRRMRGAKGFGRPGRRLARRSVVRVGDLDDLESVDAREVAGVAGVDR